MIDRILPPSVSVCEAYQDSPEYWLFPEEREVVGRAVDKRVREFTTARHCARRALAGLGVPAAPLLRGADGSPAWPAHIRGSITHCAGYRAAAVAEAAAVPAIGIDAEPHRELPGGVLETISVPVEARHVSELLRMRPEIRWDRLLFSAKESVYKACASVQGDLGFRDILIAFAPEQGTFSARTLAPRTAAPASAPRPTAGRGGRDLTGRWLAGRRTLLTAVVVSASPPTP